MKPARARKGINAGAITLGIILSICGSAALWKIVDSGKRLKNANIELGRMRVELKDLRKMLKMSGTTPIEPGPRSPSGQDFAFEVDNLDVYGSVFEYAILPAGTWLFRGAPSGPDNPLADVLESGLYTSTVPIAALYTDTDKIYSYLVMEQLTLFMITDENIRTLIGRLQDLKSKKSRLYFRGNINMDIGDAIKTILLHTGHNKNDATANSFRKIEGISTEGVQRIDGWVEHTNTQSYIPLDGNLAGKQLYPALVFSMIICWFGFDGYALKTQYKRMGLDVKFHEEIYICAPKIVLNGPKTTRLSDVQIEDARRRGMGKLLTSQTRRKTRRRSRPRHLSRRGKR